MGVFVILGLLAAPLALALGLALVWFAAGPRWVRARAWGPLLGLPIAAVAVATAPVLVLAVALAGHDVAPFVTAAFFGPAVLARWLAFGLLAGGPR